MVEFITNIVGNTVNDFIDGAMVVLTIMIIWYIIKFFLVAPPTKEEREVQRNEELEKGKKFWGKVKEKGEKSKVEQDRKKRKNQMRGPTHHIVKAQEASEYAIERIRKASKKSDPKQIKEAINDFEEHLHNAWGHLARARLSTSKTEDKESIHKIMLVIEGVKDQISKKIKDKVPEFDADWATNIKPIFDELGKARGTVHLIWDNLMNYHK